MKVVAGRWDPGGFRQLLTNPPVALHLLNARLSFQLRAAASSSSSSRSALTGALVLVPGLVLVLALVPGLVLVLGLVTVNEPTRCTPSAQCRARLYTMSSFQLRAAKRK